MPPFGPAPYPGAVDGDGEKTFTIPVEKMAEIRVWKAEHNKACSIPEWIGGVTPTSKYRYTFRESGLGDSPRIVCDCGAEFYSAAGDEDL